MRLPICVCCVQFVSFTGTSLPYKYTYACAFVPFPPACGGNKSFALHIGNLLA